MSHDVVIYEEMTCTSQVIPFEVDADTEVSVPILSEDLVIEDGVAEVMDMLQLDLFNTKVINIEGEIDKGTFVVPETCGCIALSTE